MEKSGDDELIAAFRSVVLVLRSCLARMLLSKIVSSLWGCSIGAALVLSSFCNRMNERGAFTGAVLFTESSVVFQSAAYLNSALPHLFSINTS